MVTMKDEIATRASNSRRGQAGRTNYAPKYKLGAIHEKQS